MERFCIVANSDKDIGLEVTENVKNYLESKGKSVKIVGDASELSEKDGCEMAVVLGGDGTMIQAAKKLCLFGIPVLGVNLGTLGFLTDVERPNIYGVLDQLLDGEYAVQKRMALSGEAYISGEDRILPLAFNDFIIGKSGFGRLITTKVYVNGDLVDTYIADGVLVATPTGSTAYNLSAGGPILSPTMEGIVITPICPHSLAKRSIVVAATDEIRIQVGETRKGIIDYATVSADGQLLYEAQTSDTIEIRMASEKIGIVKISDTGFYERMRSKLNRG